MAILILILTLAWCAYLLPMALRRRASRPTAIGDYRRSLSRLSGVGADEPRRGSFGRSTYGPSRSVAAARARRARKRRRDVFLGLSATAIGSFAVGLLPAFRVMLAVSLMVSTVLALYSVALLRMRAPAMARHGVRSPAYARAAAGRFDDWADDAVNDGGWHDDRSEHDRWEHDRWEHDRRNTPRPSADVRHEIYATPLREPGLRMRRDRLDDLVDAD